MNIQNLERVNQEEFLAKKEIATKLFETLGALKSEVENLMEKQEKSTEELQIFESQIQKSFDEFLKKNFKTQELKNENNFENQISEPQILTKKEDPSSFPDALNIDDLLIKTNPYENEDYEVNLSDLFKDMKNFKTTDKQDNQNIVFVDNSTHIPENIKLGVFSLSGCPGCNNLKKSLDSQGVLYINLQLDDKTSSTGRDQELSVKFEENKGKYGFGNFVPQIVHIYDAGNIGDIRADFNSNEYQKIFSIAKEFTNCRAEGGKYCISDFVDSYNSIVNSTLETI